MSKSKNLLFIVPPGSHKYEGSIVTPYLPHLDYYPRAIERDLTRIISSVLSVVI